MIVLLHVKLKTFVTTFTHSKSNNQEELFDKIIDGTYDFPSPYWDKVSDSAKVCAMSIHSHYRK